MRLYTIQPPEVLEELKVKKVFHSLPEKSSYYNPEDDLNMIEAYDWMIAQMESRIGKRPEGVIIPIWAWYRFDDESKPDMRKHKTKKPYCVIQFEKNDNEVLLSDFDLWHFVLNNCYLPNTLDEKEYDKLSEEYDALNQASEQAIYMRKKSWETIFDYEVDPKDTQNFMGRGHYTQATFWELKLDEVIKVKHYK